MLNDTFQWLADNRATITFHPSAVGPLARLNVGPWHFEHPTADPHWDRYLLSAAETVQHYTFEELHENLPSGELRIDLIEDGVVVESVSTPVQINTEGHDEILDVNFQADQPPCWRWPE